MSVLETASHKGNRGTDRMETRAKQGITLRSYERAKQNNLEKKSEKQDTIH